MMKKEENKDTKEMAVNENIKEIAKNGKIFERNLSSWSRWYNRNWYWFDFKHENK